MIMAIAILSICVFMCALRLFGVIRVGARVLATAQAAFAGLRDSNLDDRIREKELQRASLKLFGAFLSILIRSLSAFLASLAPIWLAGLMGLAEIEDVTRYLLRWDVIMTATAIIAAGYIIYQRLWPSSKRFSK